MAIEEKWRKQNRWINRSTFSTEGFEQKRETDAYSLKLVLEGKENYWIGGNRISLNCGEAFWVNKGQVLQYDLQKTQSSNEGLCLFFDTDQVNEASHGLLNLHELDLIDNSGGNIELPEIVVRNANFKRISQGILSVLDEPQSPEHLEMLHQNILELFLKHQYFHKEGRKWPKMKRNTFHELLRRVKKVDEFIEDQYSKVPNLDMLSAEIGMGPFHLQRQYKCIKGYSPFQYLQKVRIARAIDLMKSSKLDLSIIAEQIGYADLPTFSKAFKRIIGVPPSVYRDVVS